MNITLDYIKVKKMTNKENATTIIKTKQVVSLIIMSWINDTVEIDKLAEILNIEAVTICKLIDTLNNINAQLQKGVKQ